MPRSGSVVASGGTPGRGSSLPSDVRHVLSNSCQSSPWTDCEKPDISQRFFTWPAIAAAPSTVTVESAVTATRPPRFWKAAMASAVLGVNG